MTELLARDAERRARHTASEQVHLPDELVRSLLEELAHVLLDHAPLAAVGLQRPACPRIVVHDGEMLEACQLQSERLTAAARADLQTEQIPFRQVLLLRV